ncbi:hypothetical protein FA13DRAFT_1734749 [Coprinellus micaceus]|uniref:Uncharacterized protein n=1 Tax=Coprinellus micaceus TaxID=71717 RepID=A0A4Y7T7K9_COPMI|nr:hypothetical protein FA13DRAFT_1734749 [Coprinellus micaceus]
MDTALPPGITPPPPATTLELRDWMFTLSSSASSPTSTFIPYDTSPVSNTQRLIIKFYVLGGMAFFYSTVVCCLAWYIYMICFRGKFRDLPEDLQYDYDFVLSTQNLPRRPGSFVLAYDDNPEWQRVEAAKKEMAEKREEKRKRREDRVAARVSLIEEIMTKHLGRGDTQRISWASSAATLHTDRLAASDEMSGLVRARQKRDTLSFSPPQKDYLGPRQKSETPPKSILLNPSSARTSAYSNRPSRRSPLRFSNATGDSVLPTPKTLDLEKGLPKAAPGLHEAKSLMNPICTCNSALDELDAIVQKTMCEVHGHGFQR